MKRRFQINHLDNLTGLGGEKEEKRAGLESGIGSRMGGINLGAKKDSPGMGGSLNPQIQRAWKNVVEKTRHNGLRRLT